MLILPQRALNMAGIEEKDLDSPRIGIVAGSGGASTRVTVESGDIAREKGPKRIGPYGVTKVCRAQYQLLFQRLS